MGELLLPDNVLDATEQYVDPEQVARDSAEAAWFIGLLKNVDPTLNLIFVKPGAPSFEHSGRFYITRDRGQAENDQFWVIQNEHGGYCEPTEAHFRRFMSGDSQRNPNLWREFLNVREARIARAQRAKEELRREIREKLAERLDFVYDGPGLLVPSSYKERL